MTKRFQMRKIIALVGLVFLPVFLTACQTREKIARDQEALEDFICMKRGGDYDKCRASVVEERKACLRRWYALPPEQRTRINAHQEPKTPEIKACNAIGV
jgi:hypothetical protein